jgi:hypothetical protein
MAIVSLLLAGILLVYWWRAHTGHRDEFTLGTTSSTQSHFSTARNMGGRSVVIIQIREKVPIGIQESLHFYPFKQFIGWFLFLPGLWLAIKVRNMLPRPGSKTSGSD